ncbi:MAG: GntR family transcriptional regulator [Chloroflexota bacterium]|nr:GntR family transcriptional regulator [Chloroflexota bacterium]
MNLSNIRINGSNPLYKQIKNSLLSAIKCRDILPGEKTPSLEELCQRYGVSRMTARQAVKFFYLPFDRFPGLDQFDWNNVSLYTTLCKTYNVKLSQGKQFVESGCASDNIASLLEVQPKTPVLIMERLIESDKGWHVEYAHTYYRADCIRLLI